MTLSEWDGEPLLDLLRAFTKRHAILDPAQLVHEQAENRREPEQPERGKKRRGRARPRSSFQEDEDARSGCGWQQCQEFRAKVRDLTVALADLLIDDLPRFPLTGTA